MADKLSNKPGVLKLTHTETGFFFYVQVNNLQVGKSKLLSAIKNKNEHVGEACYFFDALESTKIEYIETNTVQESIILKQKLVTDNFNNSLLLNKRGRTALRAVYVLTHKETNKTIVGYSKNIWDRRVNIFYQLKNNQFKNQFFQSKYNYSKSMDIFDFEIIPCRDERDMRFKFKRKVNELKEKKALMNEKYTKVKNKPVYAFYVITHKETGKYIFGNCTDPKVRVSSIRSLLDRGVHPNKRLLELYNSKKTDETFEDIFDVSLTITESKYSAITKQSIFKEDHRGDVLCINAR